MDIYHDKIYDRSSGNPDHAFAKDQKVCLGISMLKIRMRSHTCYA